MPFAWTVALRFLREGRMQSVLIIVGATVGVGVMVFLSALIGGLQQSLIDQTLGTQAHVVVRKPEREVHPLLDRAEQPVAGRVERPAQRLESISSWQGVLSQIDAVDGVVATAASVSGGGFASRGAAVKSVVLQGVDAARYDRVIPVSQRILAGSFRVQGNEAVIGRELAEELGVGVGDKLRLLTSEERSGSFTVAGIFDLQNQEANLRWVFVSLRQGQTLLDLAGGVSTIEVRVDDVFAADDVSAAIRAGTELDARSWMELNEQLMVALRSQGSSSDMIQFFVIVAVALGIASVLVVSVVQKSREIGILKAMGARGGAILRVFLIQGFLVGLSGAVLGCLLGLGLALFFQTVAANPDGTPTFPLDLGAAVFVRAAVVAIVTGLLAGIVPARRASRLDPAVVIRHG